MSTVKKAYAEIISFLQANENVKVSKILDQVIALASAKTTRSEGATYIKDASGTTVAIFDYYFRRWMPLVGEKAVDFGTKIKTATGFNSMCKEGVSAWTKQQREAKNANQELLTKVASGEIQPSDIATHQIQIEEARKAILPIELGFDSIEAVNEYLKENSVAL